MPKAVIYVRKSTEGTEKQALSLESQLDFCRDIAKSEWLEVVEVIQESMSAKSPGRPGFAKLMQMIEKSKADTIICWKLNRLARNMVDGGSICFALTQWLIQKIHTTDGIYNPDTNTLLLSVHFGLSTMYSIDLKKDVMRGMTTAIKKGQVIRKAPIGYKYDRNNKSVLPTEEAYIIKKIFEWRVEWVSLRDIQKKAKELWLRTTKSNIDFILDNHFYYGFMEWQGDFYKWNYAPIISKELFDKANSIKRGTKTKHPDTFFLKWIVKTEKGKLLRASLVKWNIYYHGHGINISEKIILDAFEKQALPWLYLTPENEEKLLHAVWDYQKMSMSESIKLTDDLERRKKWLMTRKETIFDMRVSWEIEKELYAQKMKELHDQITQIDGEIGKANARDDDLKAKALILVELLKSPLDTYKSYNDTQKAGMVSMFSVELLASADKQLAIHLSHPFETIFSDNFQYGGASWTSVELFNLVRVIRDIPLSDFERWRKSIGVKQV